MGRHGNVQGAVRAQRLRLVVLGILVACALLVGRGTAAQASTTYDMRGEWSYIVTCTCEFTPGAHALPGVALISQMNLATGAFSGTGMLAGVIPTTISGTVEGSELSLFMEPQLPGALPFTMTTGAVEEEGKKMSGSGYYGAGPEPTGTFSAKMIRTYEEVEKEQEELKKQKEKAEKEAKEKAEKEQQEKAAEKAQHEKEAKEKAEKEQKETAEREAKEKAEKEAKEKAEKEKAEKEKSANKEAPAPAPVLTPVAPTAKTFTAGGPGTVSLNLQNTNDSAVTGQVTLTGATAAGARNASAKKRAAVLGSASFTISPRGRKLVKVKLTKSARAQLARRKTLHVVMKITTQAAGQAAVTMTYKVTLRAASHSHTRH